MSLATMDDIVGQATLTTAIQTYATDDQDAQFGSIFAEGRTLPQKPGTIARWDEIKASRGLAPVTGLMTPTPARPALGRFERQIEMYRVAETRTIPWTKLFSDRAHGEIGDNARVVVMDELADMYREIRKTQELARARSLQGSFVASTATIPGTDYPHTVTFAVTTLNKVASWANAATPIISSELPAVQAKAASTTGRPIARGIINDATYGYILGNTEVASYGKNTRDLQLAWLEARTNGKEMLNGIQLGGLMWDVNANGYIPDAGAFTKWQPADRAIFLPEDLSDVLATAEGRQALPVSNIIGRVDGDYPQLEYGFIAYAKWLDNPVQLEITVSWYGVYLLTFPQAVIYETLV